MSIGQLEIEYSRSLNRYNTFWNKLMAHPESPLASVWLGKCDSAGKEMTNNLHLQIEEIRKHI